MKWGTFNQTLNFNLSRLSIETTAAVMTDTTNVRMNKWNQEKNLKKYYYSSILNGAQGMDNTWNIQKLFLLTTCDCWASIPSHTDRQTKKNLIYRNVLPADNPKPIYSLFPSEICSNWSAHVITTSHSVLFILMYYIYFCLWSLAVAISLNWFGSFSYFLFFFF